MEEETTVENAPEEPQGQPEGAEAAQPEEPQGDSPEGQPEEAQETLYETPDGRKVDADTLAREWKENFMPEFTRKSQRLAELERKPKEEEPWKSDGWEPKTWEDVLEAAERRIEARASERQKAQEQARQEMERTVESQLKEIRKSEPDLNEDLLFAHAVKYGFKDLKNAYRNMKDTNLAVKDTEKKVVANMKARGGLPEAPKGSPSEEALTYERYLHDLDESPLEALRRINGK